MWRLRRATALSKLPTVQSESAWPRLTPSCICRDILANNWNERYGFLHLARVGSLPFKRYLRKSQARSPSKEIRDSRMRNKHQHGPDFDRCESRISIRKAIA